MPNYDYANSAGLTALSERTFEKIKKEITTDIVTSEAENPLVIDTAAAQKAKSTIVKIEPIQDLHGYDHPWPAGGGKNLLDESLLGSGSTKYNAIYVGDGTFTLSTTAPKNNNNSANLFFLAGNVSSGIGTDVNGVWNGNPQTVQSQNGYVTVCDRTVDGIDISDYKTLLEKGPTVTAYAPYSNICPISGLDEVKVERTGKNLCDGINQNYFANNSYICGKGANDTGLLINVDGLTNVTVSTKVTQARYRVCCLNEEIETYSPSDYKQGYNGWSADATNASHAVDTTGYKYLLINATDLSAIQVEVGFTATAYEPYQKFDAEVDLPTTIYGGTLNLETGELVCDKGIVDLGSLTWTYVSGNRSRFTASFTGVKSPGATGSIAISAICSVYSAASSNQIYDHFANGLIGHHTGLQQLWVYDEKYTDAAAFKTAMSGVQLCYELATPITYHLTPAQLDLLKGTNVITVNGKTIQVTYREGSLATLEEVNEVSGALTSEECTSEESNPITIETDAAQYAKKTHLTLAPVQDLHGYDHPWAGGGKNLLPNNVTDETVALNGVTLTKKNGVYSISGTATADTEFSISLEASVDLNPSANKICFLNTKAQTSGFVSLYFFRNNDTVHYWGMSEVNRVASGWSDTGNEVINKIVISVTSGTVVASGMVISPMLLPLTESNPTSFAPYSNICPITGVDEVEVRATGFNLWDEEWEVGALNSDGSVDSSSNRRTTSFIPVMPNATYYQKSPISAYIGRYAFYNADKQIVKFDGNGVLSGTKEVTSPENAHYLRITFGVNYGTTYNHDICINISDAEKNGIYEPYQGHTASLDLPEPVYSGMLDLETGEVVADMGIVEYDGSSDENWATATAVVFRASLPNNGQPVDKSIISSTFRGLAYNSRNYQHYNTVFADDDSDTLTLVTDLFETESALKSWLSSNPVQVVYELATPKTYQLTPQQLALFKGTSNISTNAKTVQVTYRKGSLATLEELNAISSDLSNVKSKLPPIIIKDGMLQVTYDDGQ